MAYVYHKNRMTAGQRYVESAGLRWFLPGFLGDSVIFLAVRLLWPDADAFLCPVLALILLTVGLIRARKKLRRLRLAQLERLRRSPGGRETRRVIAYLEEELRRGYGPGYVLRRRPRGYDRRIDPPVV